MYISCCKPSVFEREHIKHALHNVSFRIIKEGVQAAGANAMSKHIEELSLCGMFLLEASKKANKAFNVPPPSSRHTGRDATDDILTMTRDILVRRAVEETNRVGTPFSDPTTRGNGRQGSEGHKF